MGKDTINDTSEPHTYGVAFLGRKLFDDASVPCTDGDQPGYDLGIHACVFRSQDCFAKFPDVSLPLQPEAPPCKVIVLGLCGLS